MRTGIIIQARMASKRLPGKVMLPLVGKPVIQHIVERLQNVPDALVIVATSIEPTDDCLSEFCNQQRYCVVRGDEANVLHRFLLAIDKFNLETVVRITGDSPLIDSGVVATMLSQFKKSNVDYFSNLNPRTLPRGYGCEIFKAPLVKAAFMERKTDDVGEYGVIPYLQRNTPRLKTANFQIDQDHSSYRLTLDMPEDYAVISKVYDALYAKNPNFSYPEVIAYLTAHPEVKKLNDHISHSSA